MQVHTYMIKLKIIEKIIVLEENSELKTINSFYTDF